MVGIGSLAIKDEFTVVLADSGSPFPLVFSTHPNGLAAGGIEGLRYLRGLAEAGDVVKLTEGINGQVPVSSLTVATPYRTPPDVRVLFTTGG